MSTYIPLNILTKIARRIERALEVTHNSTIDEMHSWLEQVAGTCMTIDQAMKAIAENIYNHTLNGDHPATDMLIREACADISID